MAATMLTLVCSVCLLLLASGHQDPITKQTPASRQSFHRLVEIMKEKTRREMHWLNNTRKMLLQVSQHIKSPHKFKVEGSTGTEVNACQLDEKDNTTPQVVAAAFETFTQRLDPWGTVATLKDTFNQLQCFAKAQIKLSPEKEATEGKESPPRPAVIRYSKVLADRLNTSKFRLSLLDSLADKAPSPEDHFGSLLSRAHGQLYHALYSHGNGTKTRSQEPQGELLNAKIQTSTLVLKKLAVKVETAEVLLAITGAQDGKITMNNLGQLFVNTPPSSSGRWTPTHYGPYCKGIIIRGPVHTIMQRMLTEVSGAALQLENAVGAPDVQEARRELQCQIKEVTKFYILRSNQINSDEAAELFRITGSVFQDISKMQTILEKRSAQLQKHYEEINTQVSDTKEHVRKASRSINLHHRAPRSLPPTPGIKKTKVNIFQEIQLLPRCCP